MANPKNSFLAVTHNSPFANSVFPKPAMTAEEALREGRIDWTVEKRPALAGGSSDDPGAVIRIPDHFSIVRTDTEQPLSVVGKRYHEFQNADLIPLLEALAGEGDLEYTAAGSMRNGNFVFVVMKTPFLSEPTKGDTVETFLMASTGHDGKHPIQLTAFTHRLACLNQMRRTLNGKKRQISIRHTKNLNISLEKSRFILQNGRQAFEEYDAKMKSLASQGMSVGQWNDLTHFVFPDPISKDDEEVSQRSLTYAQNRRNHLTELFEGGGQGTELCGKTFWGAHNALTEYYTHWNGRNNPENRFQNNLMSTQPTSSAMAMERVENYLLAQIAA